MERMATWQIALRRLEMPVPRFLILFVLPSALAGLITAIRIIRRLHWNLFDNLVTTLDRRCGYLLPDFRGQSFCH